MPTFPTSPYYESVDELDTGRRGTPFNALGDRDYTRKFRVVTRNRYLAPLAVCAAPTIPKPYSAYQSGDGLEYDLLAVCTSLSAEQEDGDYCKWIVTATYSTQMPSGGPPDVPGYAAGPGAAMGEGQGSGQNQGSGRGAANNPEDEAPEIEWDFETAQRALPYDLDGLPYFNSARMPLTPAPMIDLAYPVLVYTRNELIFDRDTASKYSYALNSDKFLGADPEGCQCLPPKAKFTFRGTSGYWKITYRFRFNVLRDKQVLFVRDGKFQLIQGEDKRILESWQPYFLDCGTMKIQRVNGRPNFDTPIPITKGPRSITNPVALDGRGQEAVPVVANDGTKSIIPTFLKYRSYRTLPFVDLFKKGFVPGLA